MPMSAIHVLLRNSIDYAGLFPPAGLDMRSAVDNYASYRTSEDSWALGRFVLPAGQLGQFEQAADKYLGSTSASQPWQLAVLSGADLGSDLASVARFNHRPNPAGGMNATIDTIEIKAGSVSAVQDTMRRIPEHLQAYIEIPIDHDPAPLLGAIAWVGARAKVRTGGVTRDAFPSPHDLIRFLAACIRAPVPFKATAGLHHPLRADYRLTYAADSPQGPMFGFLNLFLAAAFLRAGMDEANAVQVLEEGASQAFRFEEEAINWRGHHLGPSDLRLARQEVMISFGSCSFTEPLGELQKLHRFEPRVQQA
jgi:hypothetical protein